MFKPQPYRVCGTETEAAGQGEDGSTELPQEWCRSVQQWQQPVPCARKPWSPTFGVCQAYIF